MFVVVPRALLPFPGGLAAVVGAHNVLKLRKIKQSNALKLEFI